MLAARHGRAALTISATRAPAPPTAARMLGYAGLIPNLVALGWQLTALGRPGGEIVVTGLGLAAQVYAAVILSFLGGAWWGLAAAKAAPDRLWSWLAMAVVPSLVAAAAPLTGLIAPSPRGMALLLAIGLVVSLAGDRRLARAGLAPDWWMRLRVPLSVGLAAETLAAGLLA